MGSTEPSFWPGLTADSEGNVVIEPFFNVSACASQFMWIDAWGEDFLPDGTGTG